MKLGFEVEIENCTNPYIPIPAVNRTDDGSLRNGSEFVTVPLPDLQYANFLYDYIYTHLDGDYTERCGFHFHMDFEGKPISDIVDFTKRYLKVERSLFAKYPFLRNESNFAHLLIDSSDELEILRKALHQGVFDYFEDFSKYTALNLKPLISQNTIEFRAMEAGLTPSVVAEIFSIFEALYENRPLPVDLAITEEDFQEAEAVISLIETPPTSSSSDVGDYMSEHFPEYTTSSANIPTTSAIKDWLNSY